VHVAEFYMARGLPTDFAMSVDALTLSLCSHEFLERGVLLSALTKLLSVSKILGDDFLQSRTQTILQDLFPSSIVNQKDVALLMDYNSSMALETKPGSGKSRAQRVVGHLQYLFDSCLDQNDGVAFLRFNETPDVVLPLQSRLRARQNKITDSINPNGNGATLRDCIVSALAQLASSPRKRWVVVFTCGGDVGSRLSTTELISLIHRSRVGLVIVAVDAPPAALDEFRLLTRASVQARRTV
jgi:hypothetical protein